MTQGKSFSLFCWVTAALMLLALFWDCQVLDAIPNSSYIALKTFTISTYIFLGIHSYRLRKLKWHQEIYAILFFIYSLYGLIEIDMTYSFSFLLGFFLVSIFLNLSTVRYVLINGFGFVCMMAGFVYSEEPQFVARGYSFKPHIILISTIFFLFTCLFYFLSQRYINKFQKLNEKFALIGKQSSFLIHEIKSPLNRVLMKTEGSFSPEVMKDIHRDSQKIFALVNSVEILTHQPEKLVKTFAHFEWKEIAENLRFDFNSYLDSLNIDFRLIGFEGDYFGNKYLIFQLLKNMVMNAVEAIGYREGIRSEIIISLDSAEKLKILTIKNSNSEIHKTDLEHIFDLHFTTKPNDWRRGLGLPLVKNIVEAHMGQIAVASSNNQTSFEIKLPDYSKREVIA